MVFSPSTLFACAVLLLLAALLLVRPAQRIPAGTISLDGPKGIPVLGNLLELPPVHSWFKFEAWSKIYGPLYRINLAGRTHVIVSSEHIANDLLREKGHIYSSREQLPMAAQLLSEGLRPLFLPYGDTWRKVRKLMHHLVGTNVAQKYEPVQEEESLRVVQGLIDQPEKHKTWFERFSAGVILRLAYSKPVQTGDEPYVRQILETVHTVERVASPGAYLVDTLPALMHLPSALAPFKREGRRLHEQEITLFRKLLLEGIKNSNEGLEENFCGKWNKDRDIYGISDDLAAYAIGTLFEAGAGTTTAAMLSFLLAMTLHPSEMEQLQQEVDRVVGPERLPRFEDMQNLPRVRAVAKETLRWRPVTAGGLPHMLTKDDTYTMPNGRKVFLPAGTNVHPVQWTIHREKALYPDPESFRPERWLEKGWPTFQEPLSQYPNLQNYSAFGFGRRICPGIHIAERSLYILIARIAWACEINQKLDSAGKPIIPPSYDYVPGFNTQPRPFDFVLRGRPGRASIVHNMN